MDPKQLCFPVTIYLMQLFPAKLIIQKTHLFKFGECWSPIFTKMRGQGDKKYALVHSHTKDSNQKRQAAYRWKKQRVPQWDSWHEIFPPITEAFWLTITFFLAVPPSLIATAALWGCPWLFAFLAFLPSFCLSGKNCHSISPTHPQENLFQRLSWCFKAINRNFNNFIC